MKPPILEMKHITKRFGNAQACGGAGHWNGTSAFPSDSHTFRGRECLSVYAELQIHIKCKRNGSLHRPVLQRIQPGRGRKSKGLATFSR